MFFQGNGIIVFSPHCHVCLEIKSFVFLYQFLSVEMPSLLKFILFLKTENCLHAYADHHAIIEPCNLAFLQLHLLKTESNFSAYTFESFHITNKVLILFIYQVTI